MTAELGAHEVMEIHEVLTHTIDGINQFQLYRPHVKDQNLRGILDKQIQFMHQEYTNLVQSVNQRGKSQAIPYRAVKNYTPQYGLSSPPTQSPNASLNEFDDRDVASGMLGCHKSSASMKMVASLECADPQIRRMIMQGASNCAEQAYEVWQYMNQQGYYQVPTMKEMTTNTMMGTYSSATAGNMGGLQGGTGMMQGTAGMQGSAAFQGGTGMQGSSAYQSSAGQQGNSGYQGTAGYQNAGLGYSQLGSQGQSSNR
ncbi:MAG: spore coat protein [Bacillota bacterium]